MRACARGRRGNQSSPSEHVNSLKVLAEREEPITLVNPMVRVVCDGLDPSRMIAVTYRKVPSSLSKRKFTLSKQTMESLVHITANYQKEFLCVGSRGSVRVSMCLGKD